MILLPTKIKKITLSALFIALGLSLQLLESAIPLPINLPGGKIGLCNLVVLALLPIFPSKLVVIISVIRGILGGILFGAGVNIIYSFFGALFSSIIMVLAYKFYPKVSFLGIGILGAVFHNFAQILVAATIFNSYYVFSYFPVLLIMSIFFGGFTGLSVGVYYEKK